MFDLQAHLNQRKSMVDEALDRLLPSAATYPLALHEAMRYSVMGGGKRLRPILCLDAAELLGARLDAALQPAAAVEILHTYTLIHDDLPAMDNDDLRRGRPTCHKAFGEANAILAGDALLTLAFEWLAHCPAPAPYPPTRLTLELAQAAGSRGVIAGQVVDMESEGRPIESPTLEFIHRHKTGDLIRAAVRIGAIVAGADADQLAALTRYAEAVGLAFQIADDILNATASAEQLGKAAGSDAQRGKATYVRVFGLEPARRQAATLVDEAIAALRNLPGNLAPLAAIARHIITRPA